MTRLEAKRLLGIVSDKLSVDQIRQAFAVAVRASHPDCKPQDPSALPVAPPLAPLNPASMAQLKDARDWLLKSAGAANDRPCPICRNTGLQKSSHGFAPVPCVRGCKP